MDLPKAHIEVEAEQAMEFMHQMHKIYMCKLGPANAESVPSAT